MDRTLSYCFIILWIVLFLYWRVSIRVKSWFFLICLLILIIWKFLYEHLYFIHWYFLGIATFLYLTVGFWFTDRKRSDINTSKRVGQK